MAPSKRTRFNVFSARGQHILQEARDAAKKAFGYDSAKTRADMAAGFLPRFGRLPYPWQLDVGEAFILKLDGVVIAGTGAGKTIPFMLPLLINPTKYVLIISPLKVLQHDQRFRKMKISAAAVNGDTYSAELQEATANILGLIIDEAHCISQWGGDFRKLYSLLDQLRGLLPLGTPVHAFSATLAPDALAEVCASLSINLGKAFFLNLGNDRPNITPSVVQMKSEADLDALNDHLPDPTTINSPADFPKMTIFTNSVKKTHKICQHVRKFYGSRFDENIAFLHAHRTRRAKRTVMRKFRQGKIRILVATEAAGMGADIPDIELVIQFGFPKSLSVWIQRAGRAGRSPELHARAILLVEKSAFQQRKKRRQKRKKTAQVQVTASDSESSDSDSSESEAGADDPPAAAATIAEDGKEWGKNVEEALRKYTSTRGCRRDVADEYFNNPTRRAPTGECCDNCSRSREPSPLLDRPETPQNSPSSSAHSTPSKSPNSNGKRQMRRPRGDGPAVRRRDHLKTVRSALNNFRVKMVLSDRYSQTSFIPEVILPDPTLTTLASNARIKTIEDIVSTVTNPPWMMAQRHGQEVLDLIARNREARKRATAAKNARNKAPPPPPSPQVFANTSNFTTPAHTMPYYHYPHSQGSAPPYFALPTSAPADYSSTPSPFSAPHADSPVPTPPIQPYPNFYPHFYPPVYHPYFSSPRPNQK
ncbi:P-loop containing nucleoside triphosphate hydrolase protein [Mycena vulgaris]|nr:P-loop containing nucleoside triphosphate hydrolase protein [Mycena vulgaris]